MESDAEIERRQVYYSGRVQGVGFRYTARSLAQQFKVTGYVRNLPDGRVELVAEGAPAEVRTLLRAIASEMGRYIHDTHETRCTPGGGFSAFDVRF